MPGFKGPKPGPKASLKPALDEEYARALMTPSYGLYSILKPSNGSAGSRPVIKIVKDLKGKE